MNTRVIEVADFKSEVKLDPWDQWGCLEAIMASDATWVTAIHKYMDTKTNKVIKCRMLISHCPCRQKAIIFYHTKAPSVRDQPKIGPVAKLTLQLTSNTFIGGTECTSLWPPFCPFLGLPLRIHSLLTRNNFQWFPATSDNRMHYPIY